MQRPTSVTVFGVLNLVFGGLGVLGMIFSAVVLYSNAFPHPPNMPSGGWFRIWIQAMSVLGILSCVVLMASGVGLLRLRSWGRLAAIGYSIYAIVSAVAGVTVQWIFVIRPAMEVAADRPQQSQTMVWIPAISQIVGTLLGLIFPVLLWYYMTRPRIVAAFRGQAVPQFDPAFNTDPNQPRPGDQSNPYLTPYSQSAEITDPESIVETFVPSKNGPALASYYLGLFSLIPVAGFPLGIAAVYFGIQGLKRVAATPEVRGGAHAWVGLICGALFGLFNLLLVIAMTVGIVVALQQTYRR